MYTYVSTQGKTLSLFSIGREERIVQDFLSLCLSIPLGQTNTEGRVCFWRARNPITFETTSLAPNDNPAGRLIALTTGTDIEAASHSTVCAVEIFLWGWRRCVCATPCRFYHALMPCSKILICRICCARGKNRKI